MAGSFLLPLFASSYSPQINPFTPLFFSPLQKQFVSLQLPTATTITITNSFIHKGEYILFPSFHHPRLPSLIRRSTATCLSTCPSFLNHATTKSR